MAQIEAASNGLQVQAGITRPGIGIGVVNCNAMAPLVALNGGLIVMPRLSSRTKFLYGIGDTGFSLTTTIVGTFFAIFLTDVVGMSPKLAGIAILIGGSWDYLNDPLIGHLN